MADLWESSPLLVRDDMACIVFRSAPQRTVCLVSASIHPINQG